MPWPAGQVTVMPGGRGGVGAATSSVALSSGAISSAVVAFLLREEATKS
ncbi:MAG: hypothetical protein JRM86_00110 [Nitrososphaerota archaeon]|nr:hypothetical protein [Nitrososphaerota archaeon]MDG6978213.1 hypothetical protein [Nitrososphaerota archaeon]MDG7005323.1 hypothetical protein [Nitrososphaerota archaeon]MDG7020510.1 hypothetical protein [Nitrososphaerota archaeon]MDG7021955.1 hypothetical protein [Nitrososphaerota archaeon]